MAAMSGPIWLQDLRKVKTQGINCALGSPEPSPQAVGCYLTHNWDLVDGRQGMSTRGWEYMGHLWDQHSSKIPLQFCPGTKAGMGRHFGGLDDGEVIYRQAKAYSLSTLF